MSLLLYYIYKVVTNRKKKILTSNYRIRKKYNENLYLKLFHILLSHPYTEVKSNFGL